MQIDTFTFVAQIVNFLILVVLLKKLLYGPIVRMMDQREESIRAEIEAARRQSEEAQRVREAYEAESRQLELRTAEVLSQAEKDAEARRGRLIAEAREEAQRAGVRWREAVERERSAFVRELRRRAGLQVVEVARRALAGLADDELQSRVTAVFARRVAGLEEDETAELAERIGRSGSAEVVSAFDLEPEQRRMLSGLIGERFGEGVGISFRTSPDLICGIELRTDGRKLAWSIEGYLTALEEDILRLMEDVAVEVSATDEPAPDPGGDA